jgi:hypothetical protein
VQKESTTLEKISIKPNMKIEPNPKSEIKVEIKEAKGSGQILFDNKTGRMIESTTNSIMQMQLAAQGLNFGQTIDQTVTIKLKK